MRVTYDAIWPKWLCAALLTGVIVGGILLPPLLVPGTEAADFQRICRIIIALPAPAIVLCAIILPAALIARRVRARRVMEFLRQMVWLGPILTSLHWILRYLAGSVLLGSYPADWWLIEGKIDTLAGAEAMLFTWILAALWRSLFLRPIPQAGRSVQNQCEACGYDLTGIKSVRCPECGSDIRRITPPDTFAIEFLGSPPVRRIALVAALTLAVMLAFLFRLLRLVA